jgi:hypothetical protein
MDDTQLGVAKGLYGHFAVPVTGPHTRSTALSFGAGRTSTRP